MDGEPMIRQWDDVERWLRGEAAACLKYGDLPRTVLVMFHRRQTSLVVEAPDFCDSSADAITDVACRVTHEVTPDQLVFMRAAVHRAPGSTEELFALTASLLERGRPARHLAYPLLFDASAPLVAAVAQRATDTWTRRLQDAFDRPDEEPDVVATEPPHEDDFLIAVPPDGPLSDSAAIPV